MAGPGTQRARLLYSGKASHKAPQPTNTGIQADGNLGFTRTTSLSKLLFSGRYRLQAGERNLMKQGLRGWPEMPGITGPDYFPDELTEAALFALLSDKQSVPDSIIQKLATAKAQVNNTYSLVLGLPPVSPDNLIVDAKSFLRQLQEQINDCDRVFSEQYGFNAEELDLYHRFVAKTAPILFNMGFADAIPHAGQVSRLAVIKAREDLVRSKVPVNTTTLLQTAMVGWLHDPKFPSHFSQDNLGSHPLIASAIVDLVFEAPEFNQRLHNYLEEAPLSFRQFTLGAIEALSINNDSRYVMQYVIIPRVAEQIKTNFGEEVARTFEQEAQARIDAPSQGKKPKPFTEKITGALTGVTLKTGILGINREAWENTCRTAGFAQRVEPEQLLSDILNSNNTEQWDIPRISGIFRKQKNPWYECTVDGRSLFSHHEEVCPSGKTASLALINADPLMLSPHKIIAVQPQEESLTGSLSAFMASFQSNIDDLPQESQEQARQWQRAVYIAIIRAAETLTGQDLLGNENESPHFKTDGSDLMDQVNFLCQIILMDSTWGEFGNLTKADARFQSALYAIESEYLRMTKEFRRAAFVKEGVAEKTTAES